MHFAFSGLRIIIQPIHPALNRNLLLALIGQLVYNRGAEGKEIGRWGYKGIGVWGIEGNTKPTFPPCFLCDLCASVVKILKCEDSTGGGEMKRLSSMFLLAAFCIGAVLLRSSNLRFGVILLVATVIMSVIEPVKAYGQAKDRGVAIGNEFVNFVFEEPGLGLKEVSGLLESPEGEGKLWQIELRSSTGDVLSLDNTAECETSYKKSEGKLDLSWGGIDLPGEEDALDVQVGIELEKSSGLSYWSIKVENGSENWGIWTVDFPYITGIKSEGAKLAYPQFLGRLVSLPDSLPVKMIYPCSSATMQFSAVISGSRGLYLAAHDPQCYHKEFLYEEGVSYRTRNFPEEMGLPGKDFVLPYKAVVGSFDGDWIDAAKIYRSWATKQKWCSKGRLSERTDIPDWFRDISLWFVGGPSDNMARLLDFLDTSIAFHWYNWHEIPFDKFYPDYFPPKEGFADKVQELQKTGIRIMPYINARLWDTAAKSWESENPEPYTTKDHKLSQAGSGRRIVGEGHGIGHLESLADVTTIVETGQVGPDLVPAELVRILGVEVGLAGVEDTLLRQSLPNLHLYYHLHCVRQSLILLL